MDTRAGAPAGATSVRRRLRALRDRLSVTDHSDCGELRRLAEERGALQHVATLVARGSSPPVIFNAAACAVGGLIEADYTAINRYEGDGAMSIMACPRHARYRAALWRALDAR